MKIKTKILIPFLTVSISLLLGISAGFVYFVSQKITEETHHRLESTAQENAKHVGHLLMMLKGRITDFSSDGKIKQCLYDLNQGIADDCSSEELTQHLVKNKLPIFHDIFEIFILDPLGDVIASSDKNQIGQNKKNRSYFLEGKEKAYVSPLYFSEMLKKDSSVISAPIMKDGNFEGVIAARLKLSSIFNIIEMDQEKTVELLIVDREGFLISPDVKNEKFIKREKIETAHSEECKEHYEKFEKDGEIEEHEDEEEVMMLKNHRGMGVLGGHAYAPEMGWCILAEQDKSTAFGPLNTMLKHYLLSGLFSIFILVLLINWITKKITRPIRQLQKGIEKVQKGNLDHRVATDRDDEIGQLSRAFDNMTSALRDSHIEVKRKVEDQTKEIQSQKAASELLAADLKKFKLAVANASDHIVITDPQGFIIYANKAVERITGFNREECIGKKAGGRELWGGLMEDDFYQNMWKEILENKKEFSGEVKNKRKNGEEYVAEAHITPILDKAGKKVIFFLGIERDITKSKEVDRMKTEFVSIASHQLRTPLAGMRWFLEMLLAGDMGKLKKEQQEAITNVLCSNERMIESVNDMLSLSRLESGNMDLTPSKFSFEEALKEVLKNVAPLTKKKKQDLKLKTPKKSITLFTDKNLLSHVIQNLTSNAIKYTPEKGKITIKISEDKKEVKFEIKDSGIGISKKDQPKIFGRFFRSASVESTKTGSGLGLAIAKAIIKKLNGKLGFSSIEGKGSTFWFTIPKNTSDKKSKGEDDLSFVI